MVYYFAIRPTNDLDFLEAVELNGIGASGKLRLIGSDKGVGKSATAGGAISGKEGVSTSKNSRPLPPSSSLRSSSAGGVGITNRGVSVANTHSDSSSCSSSGNGHTGADHRRSPSPTRVGSSLTSPSRTKSISPPPSRGSRRPKEYKRYARYENGSRVEWLDSGMDAANNILKWLHVRAVDDKQFKPI